MINKNVKLNVQNDKGFTPIHLIHRYHINDEYESILDYVKNINNHIDITDENKHIEYSIGLILPLALAVIMQHYY